MATSPETRPERPVGGPGEAEETSLQGLVEHVTYHDSGSLYTVLRLTPETGYSAPSGGSLFSPARVTAVGRVPDPVEGLRVRLSGSWGTHRTHGVQFEFDVLEALPPIDEEGLVRYLSSKVFVGVGETLARRIVRKLGQTALESIRDHPESLRGIRGLGPGVAEKLAESVSEQLSAHQTGAFLRGLGLGALQAQSVIAKLGTECEADVRANPYLIATAATLGFTTADRIATKLGFEDDDPRRLRAGIQHALLLATNDGHTLLPRGDLVSKASGLLSGVAERPDYLDAIGRLEEEREIICDRDLVPEDGEHDDEVPVYLSWLHASESNLAANLDRLLGGTAPPLASERELLLAEREAELELDESQRRAVLQLLATPVGLLTGGPGVGKTTIVRLVAALAEAGGASVLLASPTGRAAKRLAEATGRDASTIHRMLQFNPGTGGFEHNADKPLDAGLVIVDEISMLDVVLAHHLVKAIRPTTRLLFVGDPNQLPSVGPGTVLADLIDSGRLPVSRLTRIFRQAESSLIVANAHRILEGQLPVLPEKGDTNADFFFFAAEDPAAAADRLVEVVTRRIPETFGFDWTNDVQVIAPMYRGDCGVDALNDRLREAQGFGGTEVVQGGRRWRIGDRVIHTRNDYEKEVFNGDMGRVVQATAEGILTVRFPEQDVVYKSQELSDLRPAFAITVHRSQGGEFPVIVMPLVTQHYVMLQRNLLYTAVTRARKLVVLVGSKRALQMAVDNSEQSRRESALAMRLKRLAVAPEA